MGWMKDHGLSTNLDWLEPNTIYVTKAGSHAYGMSTPQSDLDLRGVAIPPKPYWLGFMHRFDQADMKNVKDNIEATIFNLQKFAKLAADCNPNVIELLFTDESDHVWVDEAMKPLFEARDSFISKKARYTFSGYAMSQLKRIKTHRKWLLNPPKQKPQRASFDLPEVPEPSVEAIGAVRAKIIKKLDQWNVGMDELDDAQKVETREKLERVLTEMNLGADRQYLSAARLVGLDDNLIGLMVKEREFEAELKRWQQYQDWTKNRNKTRAAMEAKFGYDAKHAAHLVRLMRMCREILEGKGVRVRRPDAQELLDIRKGAWSYDELISWADSEEKALNALYKSSALPKAPDRKKLDAVVIEMTERALQKS